MKRFFVWVFIVWYFISFAMLRMTLKYILSFLFIALVFAIGWYCFKKWKVLDRPGADLKGVRWPVPTLMWLFAYISLILVVLVLFPETFSNKIFLWLILWVLPIILVEFVEELGYLWKINFRVPQIVRLLAHIWWAILAVYIWNIWAGQEFVYWDFVWKIPQWLFVIFFVVRSMLCINAINRIDGINGQASGVSAIWFLTTAKDDNKDEKELK